MQLPSLARFIDKHSGARIHGSIHAAAERHLGFWRDWRYNPYDEDRAWDWWAIYQECASWAERYECYAAMAANQLQGLMVIDLRGRRLGDGSALIVDYLATNPASRAAHHGLKHVGLELMSLAVRRSREVGAGGRLWLEALPGAAGFYESLGMTRRFQASEEGHCIYTLESPLAPERARNCGLALAV